MTPREIIAKAWATTVKERKLRRWGFISALFETMRSVELLVYQAYYLYWFFQGVTVGWLSVEVLFFETLPFWLFITVTVFLIILLILQLFIPTLATGAIIGLAAKSYRKEKVEGGFILALYNFFPILELHAFFVLSSFGALITALSITLRYAPEGGVKYGMMGLITFLWLFALVFHFLASFGEEGIVIRKEGVFVAAGKSFKLMISNVGQIVFLLILLFVITLRIIINAVLIFVLPAVIIGLALLLALFLPTTVSYLIAGIVGFILLIVASYFFAYLHVFRQTVWTITYLELSEKKELDVIVEEGET